MDRLETLKSKVAALYEAKNPERTPWSDWLYDQHLPLVASEARSIAQTHDADPELAEAAAWLHDIADTKMKRWEDGHEEETEKIARQLMEESGYMSEQIALVVDDAVRLHGCHDGKRPDSLEGKALATADALAHIRTDFYVYYLWANGQEITLEATKERILKKVARDFNDKICFDDIRESARADYEVIQNLFSRPPAK